MILKQLLHIWGGILKTTSLWHKFQKWEFIKTRFRMLSVTIIGIGTLVRSYSVICKYIYIRKHMCNLYWQYYTMMLRSTNGFYANFLLSTVVSSKVRSCIHSCIRLYERKQWKHDERYDAWIETWYKTQRYKNRTKAKHAGHTNRLWNTKVRPIYGSSILINMMDMGHSNIYATWLWLFLRKMHEVCMARHFEVWSL